MKCMICYKKAELYAYGNSYCVNCYERSPYFAEAKAKQQLNDEKEAKKEK